MLQLVVRILFLTTLSVVFCGLTAVLGSAPLVVLRNAEGRVPFFISVALGTLALMSAGAYSFAIPFIISALLVYVFIEGLEMGATLAKAGFMALSLTSGLSIVGLSIWAKYKKIVIADFVKTQVESFLAAMPQIQGAAFNVDVDSLVLQLPSAIVILMAISLWFGALFGKKFSVPNNKSAFAKIVLRDFSIPDGFVWLFIFALAGTFLNQEGSPLQSLSVNFFNFLLFTYFLRGLAVVATYFYTAKVGAFWQGVLYLLLISQLFLLVSIIGLADVWMNFRNKLYKKTTQEPIER